MRIAVATDAWHPQTNGVVTTLTHTVAALSRAGHDVSVMSGAGLRSVPCPSYPDIRLVLNPRPAVDRWLDDVRPDALHIATEGPIGLAARAAARRSDLRFTTSYHTRFPEYLRARAPIPTALTYRALRWFHGAAARTMVATATLRDELQLRGFHNLVIWARGVDTHLFNPGRRRALPYPAPVLVCLGRVAIEKGVEDFCRLPVSGTKVVVGDGPERAVLERRYPDVVFRGFVHGVPLAELLAGADCLVFPSRTDTFGLVMLEAMAAGTPVAAYPVPGPRDVVTAGVTGVLDADLAQAARGALDLDRGACARHAATLGWDVATEQFLGNLVAVRASAPWPCRNRVGTSGCEDVAR